MSTATVFATILENGEPAVNKEYGLPLRERIDSLKWGLGFIVIGLIVGIGFGMPIGPVVGVFGIGCGISIAVQPYNLKRKSIREDIAKGNDLRELVAQLLHGQHSKWKPVAEFDTEASSPTSFGHWHVWALEGKMIFLVHPALGATDVCGILWLITVYGDTDDIMLLPNAEIGKDSYTLKIVSDTFCCRIDESTRMALSDEMTRPWL